MEGLIPLVIHAIKRSRDRSKYRCLSRGDIASCGRISDWSHDYSSGHRRTGPELPQRTLGDYVSSDPHLGPSPSLRSFGNARADPRSSVAIGLRSVKY
ncbi:hypothetical protein J5N97_015663 [Dioscorea zingiberensis]|uniref:Uncharacterized protein n=1 Tax=Dioscorea zingiberensis TaxID=325984 RepID=A0A9D5HEU8_9LILI|nr:hypothetical protein J5N97_015663 [Dioscorea zingiberensis]